MASNKNIALTVLAGCLGGAACTYPWQSSFLGGLFYHGFLAASIGGLADWYAVTALFRKPFGCISWRTEVIPKNRERLLTELQNFVCHDLLSAENIMQSLAKIAQAKQQTFSGILLKYLFKDEGLGELKGLCVPLLTNAINEANKSEILSLAKTKSYQAILELDIASAGIKALEKSVSAGATRELEEQLLVELARTIKQREFRRVVDDLLKNAWDNYRSGGTIRSLAMNLSDFDVTSLTPKILAAALRYLEKISTDPGHAARVMVRNLLLDKLAELAANVDFISLANRTLAQVAVEQAEQLSAKFLQADSEQINDVIDNYAHKFQANQEWQEAMDTFLGKAIEKFLVAGHHSMELLVAEKLGQYSTDEVVALIEDRVGNDLQLIRVNGSVIGGLTGMVLYIISQVVEGVL